MNDTFDAHVHTCRSDAAPDQTPEAVCRAARAAGLGHLCITDHDRMLPDRLRRELREKYELDVISGCEFSAAAALSTDRRVTVHVLGLWLPDPNKSQALSAVLAHNQSQDSQNHHIANRHSRRSFPSGIRHPPSPGCRRTCFCGPSGRSGPPTGPGPEW